MDRKGTVSEGSGSPASSGTSTCRRTTTRRSTRRGRSRPASTRARSIDVVRDVSTPLAESAGMPIWMPDGQSVLYRYEGQNTRSESAPRTAIRRTRPSASSTASRRRTRSRRTAATCSTRAWAATSTSASRTSGATRSPRFCSGGEFDERCPHFSPDGRWFTYSSDEPGQTEIFVRRFPVTQERWRVSTSGGQQPAWSRDGKEIFFVSLDGRFQSAPISTAGGTPDDRRAADALSRARPAQHRREPVRGHRRRPAVPDRAARSRDYDEDPFRVLLNWQTP